MTMMMTALLYRMFAQVYGAGSYNSSTYGGSSTAAASGSGGLTNTGIAVISIVTVAALLLLVAIVVRIWRRPSKSMASGDSDNDH